MNKFCLKSLALAFAALAVTVAPALAQDTPEARSAQQVWRFTGGLPGGSFLGVGVAEIDADRAKELKLSSEYGVEITRIEPDSPAEKAGLKTGDIILEYNGERVEGMEQFGRLVRETPAGRDVKLLVSRNGSNQTVTAKISGHRLRVPVANEFTFNMPQVTIPEMPQMFSTLMSGRLGVETESLGPQLASYFGVHQGVLVRSVMKDSAAEKAGIKAGDVITKANGNPITSPNELSSAVHGGRGRRTLPLQLMRDHHLIELNATLDEERSNELIPRARVVRTPGIRM